MTTKDFSDASGDEARARTGTPTGALGQHRRGSSSARSATRAPAAQPAQSKPAQPRNAASAPTIGARDRRRWERVQAQLRTQLGDEAFASWFGRCRLEAVSRSEATLSVPTTFLKTWIRTHYAKSLLTLWQKQSEDMLRIDVVVRSAVRQPIQPERTEERRAEPSTAPKRAADPVAGWTRTAPSMSTPVPGGGDGPSSGPLSPLQATVSLSGSPLDPNFTFATLVEGKTNAMAVAAARAVAHADGQASRFNPLFLHASVGLGKTHLLQAVAWAAAARTPGLKILYLTAEYFMWRFASAIRDQSALSFKESLRDIDLLLIDDMQFLQGKSIQAEFCHLLNALIDSARQVVVAADRPPAQLESLDDRVRSRLRGGVALEIGAPDRDMRRAILDNRLADAMREDRTLSIPEPVLDYVADHVASSGRDVEGAFNQLLIQHRFSEGALDMEAVERILSHLVQSAEVKRVRIEDIQKAVARHYNVSRNDILSNRRTRIIVRPRQVAMYLSKVMTPRSLPEIGRRFGGRDHTTVLHAVRKIEGLIKEDETLGREVELLQRLILEQA